MIESGFLGGLASLVLCRKVGDTSRGFDQVSTTIVGLADDRLEGLGDVMLEAQLHH